LLDTAALRGVQFAVEIRHELLLQEVRLGLGIGIGLGKLGRHEKFGLRS
jgi:hypothetical protein